MKRLLVYATLFVLLAGTVPWFFLAESELSVAGLPLWAFYSLAASLIFSFVVCFCLERLWGLSDDSPEDTTDAR